MKQWVMCFLCCLNLPACSDDADLSPGKGSPDPDTPLGSTGGGGVAASGGVPIAGDGDQAGASGAAVTGAGGSSPGGDPGTGGSDDPLEVAPDCEFDESYWHFRTEMVGSGFDLFEGKTVYARSRLADCDAAIESPVVGGSFHFFLLGVSDGPAYPQYDLFIDANGDGQCNEADGDYANATIGVVSEDVEVLLEYSPDTPIFHPTPCAGWE